MFECGYSYNHDKANLFAENTFVDSNCTIASVFQSCATDDCNVAVTPLSCNVGYDNHST